METNRAHIAVVIGTRVQEGDATDVQIKGNFLASPRQREKGEPKGGVAKYVHESTPQRKGERRTTQAQHVLEHSSVIAYPNHNE